MKDQLKKQQNSSKSAKVTAQKIQTAIQEQLQEEETDYYNKGGTAYQTSQQFYEVKYKETLQEFQKEKHMRVKLQKELEIRN